MSDSDPVVTLAMTGASGAAYGLRLLQCLLEAGQVVQFMLSEPARIVLKMETGLSVPARPKDAERFFGERYAAAGGQLRVFGEKQWTAPVASGSNPSNAMVVCPCTTGTLSSIACGSSNDLIDRAADVMLKERRSLILVVRETPFSVIHLENMLRLARMGCVIMPANPGFYHTPETLDDIVNYMVARVLDHLKIGHNLMPRWGADTVPFQ